MIILAVDYGDARTGLAVCDAGERLASPAGVIAERKSEKLMDAIAETAEKSKAGLLVVGLPLNMDGSFGPRAQKCRDFASRLSKKCSLPVELWDERCTTMAAHNALNATDTRGKKRKEVVDAVAAVMILEGFLAYRRNRAVQGEGETAKQQA